MAGNDYAKGPLRAQVVHLIAFRQLVAVGLAFGLGVMWLWAGAAKLRSPVPLANARRLIGGPPWLSLVIARTLPIVEIALGIAMLTRQWVREAAFFSFVLLISITLVLGIDYFRNALAGLDPAVNCGCFGIRLNLVLPPGRFRKRNRPRPAADYTIAARNVVRPLVFAMIAWTVAFAPNHHCACRR